MKEKLEKLIVRIVRKMEDAATDKTSFSDGYSVALAWVASQIKIILQDEQRYEKKHEQKHEQNTLQAGDVDRRTL